MKKCLAILMLNFVLAITWGGEGFAQGKKEMTFSGTHYKIFQLGPNQVIYYTEVFGVRVNDSADGPFHKASVHILSVTYRGKEYNGSRGYMTWTDKDGDKVIWELLDTPPGRLIEGTGKYAGWQGTMEFTLQYPKSFPKGTMRGICREQVIKIVAPQ
jgi:hypothetical protein